MDLDNTLIIIGNLYWFGAGCVLYYLITTLKVHIVLWIEPLYQNTSENVGGLKSFLKSYLSALTHVGIHRNALLYLYMRSSVNWSIINSKWVRIAGNTLDGLTTFLKPYLVIALIFAILKVWTESAFANDGLYTTLGKVQNLITFLSGLAFLKFLVKYELVINIFGVVILVSIPFLYERKKMVKQVKKVYSALLVYLSIIFNICFFAVTGQKYFPGATMQLTELEFQIRTVQDSIYVEATKMTAIELLPDSLRRPWDSPKSNISVHPNWSSDISKEWNNARYSNTDNHTDSYSQVGRDWNMNESREIFSEVKESEEASDHDYIDPRVKDLINTTVESFVKGGLDEVFDLAKLSGSKLAQEIIGLFMVNTFKERLVTTSILRIENITLGVKLHRAIDNLQIESKSLTGHEFETLEIRETRWRSHLYDYLVKKGKNYDLQGRNNILKESLNTVLSAKGSEDLMVTLAKDDPNFSPPCTCPIE